MAVGTAVETRNSSSSAQNYILPMILMVSLYFSIGFITALNDILVSHFKKLFELSNLKAQLVQFCFFGAYFVMSLPSGGIIRRIGYKTGIIAALCTMGCGLLLFLPASIVISYPVFLFALFVVGSGLALLQVAINPYVGALGSPDTAASRLNLCGFLNSGATTLAPKLGAIFIFVAAGATTAQLAHSVRAPYLIVAGFTFLIAFVTLFVPLPVLIPTQSSDPAEGQQGSAWQFMHLRFGALAIFTYVGAEVAIGSILINFLGQPSMGSIAPIAAATYVSFYWAGAMAGRLIGTFALLRVRAHVALAWVASIALLITLATIVMPARFLHVNLSPFGFAIHTAIPFGAIVVACGLFNSVMWPCIFPLSLKGLGRLTSQGSGILVAMIVGGALIPLAQGFLADEFGYQHSFLIVLACYAYLIFFAVSGYKVRELGGELRSNRPT